MIVLRLHTALHIGESQLT